PNPILSTDNGIHLNGVGYLGMTEEIRQQLGWRQEWFGVPEFSNITLPGTISKEESERGARLARQDQALHSAVLRKNALFFNRWRPANETYLLGFRKHEQGQNAKEIPQ